MLAYVYVFKYSRLNVQRYVMSEVKVMRVPCTMCIWNLTGNLHTFQNV